MRERIPALHRWSGRLFILLAYLMAGGGLMLTYVRGTMLSSSAALPTSLSAVLLIICVSMAWRAAVARRFEQHRHWAMRAFILANTVWFLRVILMLWAVGAQGAGMNETMSGPADLVVSYGAFLLPLGVLELYMAAQRGKSPARARWMAIALLVLTVLMAAGIVLATLFMWGPYW